MTMLLENFIGQTYMTKQQLKNALKSLEQDDDRVTDVLQERGKYTVISTVAIVTVAVKIPPKLVITEFEGQTYIIHSKLIIQRYEFGWMLITQLEGGKVVYYYDKNNLKEVLTTARNCISIDNLRISKKGQQILDDLDNMLFTHECPIFDML